MSLSTLETILKNLPPWVAEQRLEDLYINESFQRSMPFNGDYASILLSVLRSIHLKNVVPYNLTISELGEERHWPEEVIQAMIDFLQSYTEVTDNELRLACWRYFVKDSVETLKHSTFKNLRRKQPEIIDKLTRIYYNPVLAKRAALNTINLVIANLNPQERESLYLNMICGEDITHFLSSDIDRLAARCNVDIANQVLIEYRMSWRKDFPEMQECITCLDGAKSRQIGTMMDPEYTAELSRLIQTADAGEIQPLFDAVYNVCAKLTGLPRHITRNYRAALEHGKDRQHFKSDNLRYQIWLGSRRGSSEDNIFDVIYDIESACKKCNHLQHESEPHMLPESLLEAPTNTLIAIHNALILYLSSKGYPHEGLRIATEGV
ncbi:hypothetical protein PG991_011838 [Apiospora marii]|uniref:Uncharacterized protein n=1 Tax=Apiospora marii TaxID=335849 RepID=A0ABR1RGI2_9PEZI